MSLGGFTYTEGGFSSSTAAVNAANQVWAMFGPQQSGSSVNRPFGTAVLDGFDFDFETSVANMPPFAQRLRDLMDAATAGGSKKFYLSAAPQCPYPDVADDPMLNGAISFDFIMVQFYNNYCGGQAFVPGASTQNNFNFATWDNWARTVSRNRNVKVLLGLPGNVGGAGSGYISGSQLSAVIAYCKQFSSFGGVMLWDASQTWVNSGFLSQVSSALGGSNPPPPPTSTTTTRPGTTLTTSTRPPATTTTAPPPPGGGTVPQWGQCGGQGWTGPTACVSPYSCTCSSVWWCDCR